MYSRDRLAQLVEAGRVRGDVLAIDQIALDQDVDDAVEQREVGARLDRQVEVGQHRRLGDARIDDDQRARRVRLEALPEDRMVVGDVRADQQDDVGALEVLVRAGRTVAAEGPLVAGDGAGHAERRVAVVVARAEAELHQLAERVELLGDELPGADDADGVRAVLLPGSPRNSPTIVPSASSQLDALAARRSRAEQRIARARVGVHRVVLESPSGQSMPALTGMIRVAAHADGAAVLHADEHAAADRAVAAGRRHPAIGNPARGRVAGRLGSCAVGVLLGARVEAERASQAHAASLPRYGAAMCFGTTLTKNR